MENCKKPRTSLIPAINSLPISSSQHYASVLLQTEYNLQEFDNGSSLVPNIDSTLECYVQACPELIKSDLVKLFPSKDFSASRMTAITFRYPVNNAETVKNLEQIYELFIQAALDVCATLQQMGYWSDFMHPKTGTPYIEFHLPANIDKTNVQLTNFGFAVNDAGCCKVLRDKYFKERLFVGILFTDAPDDHPVLTHMVKIKR
ncbi:hypothetical protein Aperf_G00000034732 [Anoplocephala perfoliata]